MLYTLKYIMPTIPILTLLHSTLTLVALHWKKGIDDTYILLLRKTNKQN